MTENETGAMQRYGAARSAGDDSQQPGFVLLYAEGFAKLPTAWPITPSPRRE